MRPLQVTNKPRCQARVPNMWFHRGEFEGTDHQCPFPSNRAGWCKRHDPARLVETLRKKESRLLKQLATVRELLDEGISQRSMTEAIAKKTEDERVFRLQLAAPENPS